MNVRREALLWSIAMTLAIVVGLMVVWAVMTLAFGRPGAAAPLYFVAATYRQDDYSADGINGLRLNPLDPALEQEAIFEDQMRAAGVLPRDNYDTAPAIHPLLTAKPSSKPVLLPTQTLLPSKTNTVLPPSNNTLQPGLTATPSAKSTNVLATGVPTKEKSHNTQKPPNIHKPPSNKPTKVPKALRWFDQPIEWVAL